MQGYLLKFTSEVICGKNKKLTNLIASSERNNLVEKS